MSQTITIPKSFLDELVSRLERLEKAVFKKDKIKQALNTYKDEKEKGELKKLIRIDDLFE